MTTHTRQPDYLTEVLVEERAREATRLGLLASVKDAKRAQHAAEVAVLRRIIEWCSAHEVLREDEAAFLAGYGEHALGLGGPGCPLVRESAVVELAAGLGVSTMSGSAQVGVALELRYRLPRLWEQVVSGACPVWRARIVAEKSMALCEDGADEMDRHVAPFAHAMSFARLTRLADELLLRWDPEAAEAKRRAAADGRHCDIHLADHRDGLVHLDAGIDVADALALESAVREGARALAAGGSTESLDVRRSRALGALAAGEETLPVAGTTARAADTGPGRHLHLWAHVPAAAIDAGLARATGWEAGLVSRLDDRHPVRGPILTSMVREWARTAATITIRPVIDLAEAIHCDSYEVSDRLREQTELRDGTCAFPFCARPAVRTDKEHVVPYPEGPTATHNIAPCCRRHHRAKTFLGWWYEVLTPGLYLWTSPGGERYLRSHAGTHPLDAAPPGDPPPTGCAPERTDPAEPATSV